ncbi:hypothetical protein [Gluconobacter sp. GP1]|uniref:hypothetical protein n=1 Tax=Gluconobacter sp. GP1 TaxID=3046423 RepID=UPI00293E1C2B|nr:hypothetical protein [Gluconobacter sp. GP1]
MYLTCFEFITLPIALFFTLWIFFRGKKVNISRARYKDTIQPVSGSGSSVSDWETSPLFSPEIHFGTSLENPSVTVRSLPSLDLDHISENQTLSDEPSLTVSSRLLAVMQGVPSILVAEAHKGRRLMEVVINGGLVRAADGDGFRGFAMGSSGIREHARFFDINGLTKLVNAAAVWQLASIIVAQKHMADISQKLGEIKKSVKNISDFLEDERRASIIGTYQYLQQAHSALTQGEMNFKIRGELEACERDLLSTQIHLIADIKRRTHTSLTDDDMFGTESLFKNTTDKYRNLGQVVGDLEVCLKTRALSWYILSLFPGEVALKSARLESIQQGLNEIESIKKWVTVQGDKDVGGIKSRWNQSETLVDRRKKVREEIKEVQNTLRATQKGISANLTQTQKLLLERDTPTQIIVEFVDGVLKPLQQRELPRTKAVSDRIPRSL